MYIKRYKKINIYVCVIIISVLTAGFAFAGSADSILDSVKQKNNFRWSYMDVKMVLEDSMGVKRERAFKWYMENNNAAHKGIVIVNSPADMSGMKFLSIENGKEHLQYVYMPSMNRVRRIGMGESYSSFLGSDLTYYDLKQKDYSGYSNTLTDKKNCPQTGGTCYVIKTVFNSTIPYTYIVQWIKVDDLVPVKVSFYNASGLVKVLEVKEIKKINGYDIAVSTRIHNMVTDHTTDTILKHVSINMPLDEKLFSVEALK